MDPASEAPAVAAPPTAYVVRYGATRQLGEFSVSRNVPPLARQAQVIVRSERGVEWGVVLSPASARTREYLGRQQENGRILRIANADDQAAAKRIQESARQAFLTCRELIKERKLQMDLVDVEQLHGGERIVFYYLAEQRVDFRDLVKALAKDLHARIEMRQIGVRDEAKLLADYGDCGKPVCCNTHLQEMPHVSMKMAKMQKATLDPSKISGRCGRLKCCLRYEFEIYEEHRKTLPSVGSTVVAKQGTGRVIGQELLSKKLMVAFEGRQLLIDLNDVVTVIAKTKPPAPSGKPPRNAPSADGESSASSDTPATSDAPAESDAEEDDFGT